MKKKKVNPADLDITPKEMGASHNGSKSVSTSLEACDLSRLCNETVTCDDTLICFNTEACNESNTTGCVQTENAACGETHDNCNTYFQCPHTNVGCVDSKSAAVICCAHTGNDCVESGNACPDTSGNCVSLRCEIRTEQIDCLSEICPVMSKNDECPVLTVDCALSKECESFRHCQETETPNCFVPEETYRCNNETAIMGTCLDSVFCTLANTCNEN